jgi:signal transduction histidine kinase
MAPFRAWLGAPRRLAVLFLGLLLVPAAAVVWLGIKTIDDDRLRQARDLQERRERAANQFISAVDQIITTTELRLKVEPQSLRLPPDDPSVVVIWPLDLSTEATSEFADAERLENQRDLRAAASAYRALTSAPGDSVRAGAWLRLARTQRKLGEHDAALASFRVLSELPHAQVAWLPADFVARRASCDLLSELHRSAALVEAAGRLEADLMSLRWPMDPDTWRNYLAEVIAWHGGDGPPSAVVADRAGTLEWLWRLFSGTDRLAPASGRVLIPDAGDSVGLWRRQADHPVLIAFVAGPALQQREWLENASAQLDGRRLQAAVLGRGGRAIWGALPRDDGHAIRRTAAETALPWTVVIADRDPIADSSDILARRRLLWSGLALLVAVVLTGGYVIVRAITREFAVAELQSDFVSAVSHEFRTPLTSLRQFTDLLNADSEPEVSKRRMFHQAQARATDRLQRLVESLLDFARMEAGARPYDLKRVAVAPLVREVTDEFRKDALPAGFRLDVTSDEKSLHVQADRAALARALWNLLDNAVKYSGDGRSILVIVDRGTDGIRINIQDSGIGIPLEEQSRIFGKFVRGSASRSQEIRGTGIGLAMVHHIMKAHHGRTRVTSAPGAGSTFTLVLPEI